jgi:hypothetical protein
LKRAQLLGGWRVEDGLVQHRFCKFVAAGLRGCVGRSDEGA